MQIKLNLMQIKLKPKQDKSHLLLLDALRGVAALLVVWYHTYEGFATDIVTQSCNHGYLAVDFFFILSGFVIGYAYDDRWQQGLSLWTFVKRRLVRLHPMVVIGTLIGVITFLIQGCVTWEGVHVGGIQVLTALIMGMLMLPLWPGASADVRGNGEMFPLNGPYWSLFFEYIGNLLYALLLRRLPTKGLALISVLSGSALAYIVLTQGYLGVGWSFVDGGFWQGMIRLLFPYSTGMWLARIFSARPRAMVQPFCLSSTTTFIICTLALLILLPMPFVGSGEHVWQNGLFILGIVLIIFPTIVWVAARASESDVSVPVSQAHYSRFLADLSYPLYAVHYPFMYLFYAYIGFPNVNCTMEQVCGIAFALVGFNILLAYLLMKFYDQPIRRWLTEKFL